MTKNKSGAGKSILFFSILIILVLGSVLFFVSALMRRDAKETAEENNIEINERTANSIQLNFSNLKSNATILFELVSNMKNKYENEKLIINFFNTNKNVFFIFSPDTGLKYNGYYDTEFVTYDFIQEFVEEKKESRIKVYDSSRTLGFSGLIFIFDYGTKDDLKTAAIGFGADNILDLLDSAENKSILVDEEANILIDSDYENGAKRFPLALSLINSIRESGETNYVQNFLITEEGKTIVCVRKIENNLYVISTVSGKKVYGKNERMIYHVALFALAALFVSIFVIRIFSGALVNSTHVEEQAAPDGVKENACGIMQSPRAEDTRVQDAPGKNRNATILFCDIRAFGQMAEKMSAEEVVNFLNRYMTKMTECVTKTNGYVDKCMGDTVMAVWGVKASSGSTAQDAMNAVVASLMMRVALYNFNKERSEKGLPSVKIGCCINTGSVVAGFIGPESNREYTVIGDAIKLANKTEFLNKSFGTDIIITENTYKLVKDKIIAEELPGYFFKGQNEEIKMYAVINLIGKGKPENIAELRKIIETTAPEDSN